MRKKIFIIGGGPTALMLGCELDPKKYEVHIFEKNKALARKFLVAGEGGLNLSHCEDLPDFIKRYHPAGFLDRALQNFSNKDLINWLRHLGIETYCGSSGRLFPRKEIKPITVLKKMTDRLAENDVVINCNTEWMGFNGNKLVFKNNATVKEEQTGITIFCLGGASWPVTGTKGDWLGYFAEKNIPVSPFRASNCAFKVDWSPAFMKLFEGKALKNALFKCGLVVQTGEAVLTKFGIEGNGVYPLSDRVRAELDMKGHATILIDLKPALSTDDLLKKLSKRNKNISDLLRSEVKLSEVAVQLVKATLTKEEFLDHTTLAATIKDLPLHITGLGPLEEAISSVGGISLAAVDENFELKRMKDHFVAGEMLDYDAPTGGYLLQSCFSIGKLIADHLNGKLN